MAEVLTQDEIDALLKNVSVDKVGQDSAEDKKDTVYLYDFKHPSRVSKDQLRSLRTIHEGFARMLGTYLTTLLRTIVDVHLLSIDQVTFLEFTMAMSNPGCIWVFNLKDYEGKGIIEVSPDLIILMIEKLFGGEGKHLGESRAISVIEQNVAGKIIERCLKIYDEAWEKAIPIETQLVSFEMNPQFAQVAPASETAVVMFLEINVRNTAFPVNICFPYFVLDPIIQKLTAENWIVLPKQFEAEDGGWKIESALRNSEVETIVHLGETTLTVRDLLDLERDDVIVLDTKVDDLLKISVGNHPRFLGTVGVLGKKRAMCVEEVLIQNEDSKNGK